MRALGLVSRWSSRTGAVFAAFAVSSCAFILDFDKFERCPECAGAVETTGEQTSHDAPAIDAGRPRCAEASSSLSEFVELAPLEADLVIQTDVLTTPTRIYHTAYVSNGGKPDVVLRAFDSTGEVVGARGDTLAPIATLRLSELLADALSNGKDMPPDEVVAPLSMVPTPGTAGGLTLYTAIAAPGATTGYVVELELGATWPERAIPKPLTEIPNFQVELGPGRSGPAAGTLKSGAPFVVWQGCKPDPDAAGITLEKDLCKATEGSPRPIYAHTGSEELDVYDLAELGIAEDLPATSIRALSGDTKPAAVWATSMLGDKQMFVKAGLPAATAAASVELVQCDDPVGGARWLSTASISGAVNSVAWSKSNAISEATRVQCSDEACRDLAETTTGDGGTTPECSTAMVQGRIFAGVAYLAHGVWTDSNADEDAYTVAAFTTQTEDKNRVVAAVTQGIPDPNAVPLLAKATRLELPASRPTKVVLSLQKHDAKVKRAVAAVGWIEGDKVARATALDLCLSP